MFITTFKYIWTLNKCSRIFTLKEKLLQHVCLYIGFFLGLLQADLCAHGLVVYSYRIYEDDIVEPGMLGSTAINRCVALSEFDVSDAHITNHSASSTTTAATAAAGTATSSEHLPSDQSSVVYSVDVFNSSVVDFVAVVDHQK